MIRRNSLSRGFVEKNQDIFADDEILYHPKHYYFEICWEVVNRVGGIYTVLRTKADQMLSELKNKYFMVGPYYQDKVVQEVEFCAPPILINSVIQILSKHGIKIYFGRWLIDITGVAPYVILVDVGSAAYKLDEWKGKLWNHSISGSATFVLYRDYFDICGLNNNINNIISIK
ncbi:hypothetical protein A3Q56_05048 [Intoshia linei]|uniref:Glycogen [starch] synthase n=1 Tax=Intoshia linei TaxID=1819745 RepID=A0A177AZD7_9BILA|nr:hypothetical protein A3Q56_05048 [Intoshia linei]